jgi:hypothetical protein
MVSKQCPSCGEVKADTEFGRNRSLGDGLSFYCLACNRGRNRAWYRNDRSRRGLKVRDHSWVPEGFRWCPTCQEAVPLDEYVKRAAAPSGYGSQCKRCHNRASNEAYWLRQYGIPRTAVEQIRAKQSDRCALCAEPHPEHLDHDHSNDFVRALLCQRCNFALGLLRDDPSLLRAAADYVEIHRIRYTKAQFNVGGTGSAESAPEGPSRPGDPPVGSQRRPGPTRKARGDGRGSERRRAATGEADT